MSGSVVVDASAAVPWVITEQYTPWAVALQEDWERQGVTIHAPGLFASEVATVLLKNLRKGVLSGDKAAAALSTILDAVTLVPEDAALAGRALTVANSYQLWKCYDFSYVALAERLGCELWTADEALVNLTRARFPFVRHLSEHTLTPAT